VGADDGTTVGNNVGFPPLYVGKRVGEHVGADDGLAVGSGVG